MVKTLRSGKNLSIKCPGGYSSTISDGVVFCPMLEHKDEKGNMPFVRFPSVVHPNQEIPMDLIAMPIPADKKQSKFERPDNPETVLNA